MANRKEDDAMERNRKNFFGRNFFKHVRIFKDSTKSPQDRDLARKRLLGYVKRFQNVFSLERGSEKSQNDILKEISDLYTNAKGVSRKTAQKKSLAVIDFFGDFKELLT